MTKVYVVLGDDPEVEITWVSAVFTNKKKAEAYINIMNVIKPNNHYDLVTENICTIDFSSRKH